MVDNVISNDKWEFNQEVAQCFDDMLSRSIPNYNTMRELTFNIGKHFITPNTNIVDVGCSNGLALKDFVNYIDKSNTLYMCDVSEPMLEICSNRYKEQIQNKTCVVLNHDLRNGLPCNNNSLVLSILTIQFTPIEYRHKIVKSIYDSLTNGGAFIFVEKVLGNTFDIDNILVKEYYNIKKEHCYTQEQIQNKRKSLEGVLVPITAKWNEDLLQSVGFKQVDCFWRCLNFCGWLAIK